MFPGKAALVLWLILIFCAQDATSCRPRCGIRASCKAGECHCGTRKGQNPYFRCYDKIVDYAEISNDPSVLTFFGESIQLPLPCSFEFAHFSSHDYGSHTHCFVEVDAFIAKQDGKFYVKGFRLDIYIDKFYRYSHSTVMTVTGEVENGVYKYIERQNDDNSTQQVIRHPHYTYDYYQRDCSFIIEFTGYDTVLKADALYTPGLSVSLRPIKDYLAFTWGHGDDVASIPFHPNGLSTEEHALFLRVMRQDVPEIPFIDIAPECNNARSAKNCPQPVLRKALDNCFWLLTEPHLIRCVDDTNNGNKILYVFNQCVRSWCNEEDCCFNAINFIKDKKCHERDDVMSIQKVPGFLRGCNCPPEYRPDDC